MLNRKELICLFLYIVVSVLCFYLFYVPAMNTIYLNANPISGIGAPIAITVMLTCVLGYGTAILRVLIPKVSKVYSISLELLPNIIMCNTAMYFLDERVGYMVLDNSRTFTIQLIELLLCFGAYSISYLAVLLSIALVISSRRS